jgi:hypothetical protein
MNQRTSGDRRVSVLALTADERALLARLPRAELERRQTHLARDVLAMVEAALSPAQLRRCFAELKEAA